MKSQFTFVLSSSFGDSVRIQLEPVLREGLIIFALSSSVVDELWHVHLLGFSMSRRLQAEGVSCWLLSDQLETRVCESDSSASCLQEIEKCDLPSLFVTRNSGCRKICTVNIWQPQCCHSYYGRDCLGETTCICDMRQHESA